MKMYFQKITIKNYWCIIIHTEVPDIVYDYYRMIQFRVHIILYPVHISSSKLKKMVIYFQEDYIYGYKFSSR